LNEAMRWLAMVLVLSSGVASAHPPPEPEPDNDIWSWRGHPAIVEWSTWFRLGWGVEQKPITLIGARTMGTLLDRGSTWETGLGLDISLPIGSKVRFGAWGEMRGWEPFAGGEILITGAPSKLDMFFYDGEGVLTLRAGGSQERATASLGWGYRCPWHLSGPYDRSDRYEIGAKIVLTATRAQRDPSDWSATLGIEVEPVGAIRYLFGIRSWYH
jgi:hypothetical protein